MTVRVFKYSLIGAIVLVAVAAGAWYFLAPPKEADAMPGSISGTVSYPSEGSPAQHVCAVPVKGSDADALCVDTQDSPPAPNTFTIKNVPPGDYYVYAQLKDPKAWGSDISGNYKAYYNQFVLCGLRYDCKDTTKIVVHVTAATDTPGIEPHDWYH